MSLTASALVFWWAYKDVKLPRLIWTCVVVDIIFNTIRSYPTIKQSIIWMLYQIGG